ncbi:hypothetical protein MAN_10350, partial [Metarhizium hybridum]
MFTCAVGAAELVDVPVPLVVAADPDPNAEAALVSVAEEPEPELVPVTFVPGVVGKLAPLGTGSVVSMTGGNLCSGGWPVGGGDACWAVAPRAKTSSSYL